MKKKNDDDEILFICVATECKLYLKYLSALVPNLRILGSGEKWKNFSTKYHILKAFLEENKNIHDKRVVCVIDAYDILPTPNIHNLKAQFQHFKKENPETKMVIGYDRNPNPLIELFSRNYFGCIQELRLNGGQFIGYKKDLLHIIKKVLNTNPDFVDDQIELTKYANNKKENRGHIWIDKEESFFKVCNEPLTEVDDSILLFSFVHANTNGFMTNYLSSVYGIRVPLDEQLHIWKENHKNYFKKTLSYVGDQSRRLALL